MLLEREAELGDIDEAVAAAAAGAGGAGGVEGRAGAGRAVVIEGEPGIGKTALLGVAASTAASDGMTTLSARAPELERDFGFGVVRQLFERTLREPGGAAMLAGQARLAAPVLGI